MTYKAATKDIVWTLFLLNAGLDTDTNAAVLEEAAKLAEGVIAPLNALGDKVGTPMADGTPQSPAGFADAYKQFCAGGWNGAPFAPEHGGQGLPWALAFGLNELWQGANLSFGLCPLLNQGAIETILTYGTPEQIAAYIPNLMAGTWSGTMNLTEAGAGSDLAEVKTMATPQADGTYRVKGQKIFITYGDHNMADNIIHLVLSRTVDAPAGMRGLSLFIVPKFLADGARNDVTCVGVEHKMGIHASPTCTLSFGERDGAVGYLLGSLHQGLKHMFTMMNNARLSVGVQGVGLSARACAQAQSFAAERLQGRDVATRADVPAPINRHADVRRMLWTMESLTSAARFLALRAGVALDANDTAMVELLTPLVKTFATETSVRVASEGVQVLGGMGFVEDGGMAQNYRDARILPIYEGTNGIQAMDFVFRKVAKDKGATLLKLVAEISDSIRAAGGTGDDLEVAAPRVLAGLDAVIKATAYVSANAGHADMLSGVCRPYLDLVAHALAGGYLYLSAAKAQSALRDGDFSILPPERLDVQIIQARFFATHILPPAVALVDTIEHGGACVAVLR